MMMMIKLFLMGFFISSAAMASDEPIELRIRGNKFIPDQIRVKGGKRFRLLVINEDTNMKEFESNTMMIEKFLMPPPSRKSKMIITLGPLKKGTTHHFFDEFNQKETFGTVVVE